MRGFALLLAGALIVSSAVPGVADAPASPPAQVAAADTPSKLGSAATFTIPKDWSSQVGPKLVLLTAPEGDLHVALVDVGAAASARDAAAKAWNAYKPGGAHPLRLVSPVPGKDGWDEGAGVEYETSSNEKLSVGAEALRRGHSWTVLILDGYQGTAEKRGAAVGLIVDSLRPIGFARETFAGRRAHALDPKRVAQLLAFLKTGMAEFDVPGVGFGLEQNGKTLYAGGIGFRDLATKAPVDAHTRFMIASNTKGLTTLMLARLVDRGKLQWDEPVVQAYPEFRLGNDDTTKRVEIKHLICACTGIPRKDLEWILNTRSDTPASKTFDLLAATQPTSGFGEVFQYSNVMAAAAGYIGGHVLHPDMEIGAAYDRAMNDEVFEPLGMRDTTFSSATALAGDHATAYAADIDGRTRLANASLNGEIMPFRPAGAAWSTVHDMLLYANDELREGVLPNGVRYVSEKNLLQRRAKSVPTGERSWYGMGLEVDDTYDVQVVHHGGDLTGYHSDWYAIPGAGVTAVILTNADDGYNLRDPLMRRMLELLYDGKPTAAADMAAAAQAYKAEIAKERPRLTSPASADLAGTLAEHYTNPDLGTIDVERRTAGTAFNFGAWESPVATRHNDDGTTSFVTIDPGVQGLEFVPANRDGKRALVIRDGQHEYVYTETT
jgi:CubicO group peptidase (beta-lactamase class C family)